MRFTTCSAITTFWIGMNLSNLWAQSQQNFIPVAPCRVVDTRTSAGTFGGPTMAAASTRSFPIPSGPCGIPPTATAYSLNVTVVPADGGPLWFLTIWPTGQSQPDVLTLNSQNGAVIANAAIVPAGMGGAVSVYVTNATDVILDIDGYFVAETPLSSTGTSLAVGLGTYAAGQNNTAIGINVLQNNTPGADASGIYNTGLGSYALATNTSGESNTAVGSVALNSNTTGGSNVAVGTAALLSNTTGSLNVAIGASSMISNTVGRENNAVGSGSLQYSTGSYNTAMGSGALLTLMTGDHNIAIGSSSGVLISAGSHNIDIGNEGTGSDSGILRIGDTNQTSTYISGIFGVNPGGGGAVFVTPSGQLYSPSSSQRYKDDIHDIGDAS